ncbi:MAG: type III-B CRISPR module RAMP protein Cmr4 [Flavobacteriales bacterium]|nr:type III-B CRISPR module RAMP protein Cmr4 [Flavobacteriales bacterium]
MKTNNNTSAYLLTCITNLHAGSGDANFGVIDNLVQRDSISKMPTINASSLKGALRQFCDFKWKDEDDKNARINHIFGPDTARNKKDTPGIGHFNFFNADLLSLPAPSNKQPFFRAISPFVVEEIRAKSKLLGCELSLPSYTHEGDRPLIKSGDNVKIDDFNASINDSLETNNYIGENIALFKHDQFKQLTQKLPVVARNKLNKGISENLWYEEVVPRETRFIFFINKEGNYQEEFDKVIQSELVQVGANASVGMGYVNIKKIEENE